MSCVWSSPHTQWHATVKCTITCMSTMADKCMLLTYPGKHINVQSSTHMKCSCDMHSYVQHAQTQWLICSADHPHSHICHSLSLCLSVVVCLCHCLSVYLSISIDQSICLSSYHLFIYLYIYLSLFITTCLPGYLSINESDSLIYLFACFVSMSACLPVYVPINPKTKQKQHSSCFFAQYFTPMYTHIHTHTHTHTYTHTYTHAHKSKYICTFA